MKKEIAKFSGKFKSCNDLMKHINKEYKTNMNYHEVYYQQSLNHELNFGKFSSDASILLTICQEEKNKYLSDFRYSLKGGVR